MNSIIKKTISIIILVILLSCISTSLSGFIYYEKNECSDDYKCKNNKNKCVDIPLYYSRDKKGKCILSCLSIDRCISGNTCIEIPKGSIKGNNNECIRGNIAANIGGNVSVN